MKLRIDRIISVCLIVLALALAGCDEQSEKTAGATGTVKASAAYLEHFGQPPTPEEGTCYARVGFYPLRDDPDKVRAVPFFIYRETGQLQQLLERLAVGGLPLRSESGLFDPFPEGASVDVELQKEGRATLNLGFSGQTPAQEDLKAMALALAETALQYDGIERVVILLDGEPLPEMPPDGFRHEPARIAAVGPPVLFMVIADWDGEGGGPGEVAANFDRPVEIESFRLEDPEGRRIEGDYYQSVFNMSVIVHPDSPETIHEGMPIRARWDIVDALGRRGEGSGEFRLQRYIHQEREAASVSSE